MSKTTLAEVQDQIQTKWSPVFMQELRESFILQQLVSKQYEGEMKKKGDTVKVSQVNSLTSELRDVGSNADTFEANQLSTSSVDIKADKRAVSAVEFDDLVEIQSIIDPTKGMDVRKAMMHDVGRQINDYLYSLMIPSTSTPDHTINSQATLTNALMASMRTACAEAFWPKTEKWYSLLGPAYYGNFLADNNMINADFGFTDQARVGGQVAQKRYGFDILEDDSAPLSSSLISFLPEAILFAAQTEARFKISDSHSNSQFAFKMSVDLVFGAKVSIDGNKKMYTITSAA
jgi:hypothetical protein